MPFLLISRKTCSVCVLENRNRICACYAQIRLLFFSFLPSRDPTLALCRAPRILALGDRGAERRGRARTRTASAHGTIPPWECHCPYFTGEETRPVGAVRNQSLTCPANGLPSIQIVTAPGREKYATSGTPKGSPLARAPDLPALQPRRLGQTAANRLRAAPRRRRRPAPREAPFRGPPAPPAPAPPPEGTSTPLPAPEGASAAAAGPSGPATPSGPPHDNGVLGAPRWAPERDAPPAGQTRGPWAQGGATVGGRPREGPAPRTAPNLVVAGVEGPLATSRGPETGLA